MKTDDQMPSFYLLTAHNWKDYELVDSGQGQKLERFGSYLLVRPEHQALWTPALASDAWDNAHAVFIPNREESGGTWKFNRPVKTPWQMTYKNLRFLAFTANSRHMGVFPEQTPHWDWMQEKILQHSSTGRPPIKVLNLFGYTGLATLAAAQAGAQVTHVDASKKSIMLARENQQLSNLGSQSIRWLVDDAFKFVRREVRRGSRYEGILLDPPKFGRGPQGQVWEIFESLPELLQNCRQLLSDNPLFIIMTAYAIRASALSIYFTIQETVADLGGKLEAGELTLRETSSGRMLSTAIFSRWSAN